MKKHLKRAVLVGIALFLFMPVLEAKKPPPNPVEAVMLKAWEQMQPSKAHDKGPFAYWHARLTPPFPINWPLVKELKFDYYAYAYRLDPQLADGEYQVAPWARIRVQGPDDQKPQLKLLSKKLREIGVQGVQPLTKQEAAIAKEGPAIQKTLLSLNGPPSKQQVRDIKAYYCLWLKYNGGAAKEIKAKHSVFIQWLECK